MSPIILDVECIVCNKTLEKIKHDPQEASINMGKITNRRSRTPNWSLDEKQFLLEQIKKHKEIVVTKSNNGPNHSEEKDVAWNEILRQLTEKFGTKFAGFSIKKVKTQWQNMKRIAREELNLNGSAVQNFTRQSLEVCDILELVKEGGLKKENDKDNEPIVTTNVEIKSESIDEDNSTYIQPSCSGIYAKNITDNSQENTNEATSITIDESAEINDNTNCIDIQDDTDFRKSAFSMTETSLLENITKTIPLHKEFQEFLKYSSMEKQIKMESLQEERHVVRAMRETAELNKIIAEQKLKHILWLKKQEMALV